MKNTNEILNELYRAQKYREYIDSLINFINLSNDKNEYIFYLDRLIGIYLYMDKIQELEALRNNIVANSSDLKMRVLRIDAKLLNYKGKYLESYELLNEILKHSFNSDILNNVLFLIDVRISLSALYRKTKRTDWMSKSIKNLEEAEILYNQNLKSLDIVGFETDETLALLYYEFALNYEEMGKLSKAYDYMILAKNVAQRIAFSPVYLSILNLQITILVAKGEINQIKEFAAEVLSLKDQSSLELIDIYDNIGRGLYKNDDYDYANIFFTKAIELIEQHNISGCRASNVYNNFGLSYLYGGFPDKALQYFKMDLNLQYAINDQNNAACGAIYNNIGKAYFKMRKYKLSEKAYLESISIKKQFDEAPNNFSAVYNNLAELNLQLAQNASDSKIYIQKAIDYINLDAKVRNPEFIKSDLISRSTAIRTYNFTKEYEKSYEIAQKGIKNYGFRAGQDSISDFNNLLDLLEELCFLTSNEIYNSLHEKCEKLYLNTISKVDNETQYSFKLKSLYEIIVDVYNIEPEFKNNYIAIRIKSNTMLLLILSNNIDDINECINFVNNQNCDFRIITNRLFRYIARGKLQSKTNIYLYSDYKIAIENKHSIYENITFGIFKNDLLPEKESWICKNEKVIHSLENAIQKIGVNLFLGAGASIGDGGKTWDELIEKLFSQNINLASNFDVKSRNADIKQYIKDLNLSPLSLGRFLQNNNAFFIENLKELLYENEFTIKEGSILDIIAKNIKFFNNIVTYNYDDYLERYLSNYGVKYKIVCNETDSNKVSKKLHIYHVHGFLPHTSENGTNIVWREEDYHELYENISTWNNAIQLKFLKNDSNLFIGHSLTDPNLRRLLDSIKKFQSSNYVFLRDQAIDSTYRLIQENIALQLNIKIIWVQEFCEIKDILIKILQ